MDVMEYYKIGIIDGNSDNKAVNVVVMEIHTIFLFNPKIKNYEIVISICSNILMILVIVLENIISNDSY